MFAGGDVYFLLPSVEEGEGKDGNGCYAPDIHESVCQGVSVLVMDSSSSLGSRDEARLSGRKRNVLTSAWSAFLDSGQNRPGGGWDLNPLSFLIANIEQGA